MKNENETNYIIDKLTKLRESNSDIEPVREIKKHVIIGDYFNPGCHNYIPHSSEGIDHAGEVSDITHQVEHHLNDDHKIYPWDITMPVGATKRLAKKIGAKQKFASAIIVGDRGLAAVKETFGPEIGKTLHIAENHLYIKLKGKAK